MGGRYLSVCLCVCLVLCSLRSRHRRRRYCCCRLRRYVSQPAGRKYPVAFLPNRKADGRGPALPPPPPPPSHLRSPVECLRTSHETCRTFYPRDITRQGAPGMTCSLRRGILTWAAMGCVAVGAFARSSARLRVPPPCVRPSLFLRRLARYNQRSAAQNCLERRGEV